MTENDRILTEQFPSTRDTSTIRKIPAGALDGFTLFRFAHMFRRQSAGGMEGYLGALNGQLLERNRLRILQMYLSPVNNGAEIEIERVGRGELVWIPSFFNDDSSLQTLGIRQFWRRLKRRLFPEVLINHDTLLKTLNDHVIDLAAFHWISQDSIVVLRHLKERRIPFVVINHFQNGRLSRPMANEYVTGATGIGGVSETDVPQQLKAKFSNLSDGIDTEFFQPKNAIPTAVAVEKPLILLPSRITEGKGHVDAVRALGWLARHGPGADLAFAGREESSELSKNLKELARQEGVEERVIFLGELKAEDLRDWYEASDVVLLTSHSEGLGRVLLEAQAMKKAVVAYDVGGVVEAVEHGLTGYLVRRGDLEGLGQRLKELLEDEERRGKMGCHGRKRVLSRFSVEALAARHEEFYFKAVMNLNA